MMNAVAPSDPIHGTWRKAAASAQPHLTDFGSQLETNRPARGQPSGHRCGGTQHDPGRQASSRNAPPDACLHSPRFETYGIDPVVRLCS